MIYCDTSLIVAALTAEASSERARDWLSQERRSLTISPWTDVEVASALLMKEKRGALDAASRADVERLWRDMRRALLVLPIVDRCFSLATMLIGAPPLSLRPGDALHLAVAIDHRQELATFDIGLAQAARARGLVIHPA